VELPHANSSSAPKLASGAHARVVNGCESSSSSHAFVVSDAHEFWSTLEHLERSGALQSAPVLQPEIALHLPKSS